MATTYYDCVKAIEGYYGTDSDVWRKFAPGGSGPITEEDIRALRQVPGVEVTVTKDGKWVGMDYTYPFESVSNPASNVNSNVPNKTYGSTSFNGRINGTYQWDGTTQTGRLTSGARSVSTGTRVATVAGKLNTAMTAVAAGMFLGAKIDSALYNIGKFFDLNPPESLDPNTWDSLASTEAGKDLIRHLFDIDGDNSTMYMPEDMIEYMYKYWNDLGVWSEGGVVPDESYTQGNDTYTWNNRPNGSIITGMAVEYGNGVKTVSASTAVTAFSYHRSNYYTTVLASRNPFTVTITAVNGTQSTVTADQSTDFITGLTYYKTSLNDYDANYGRIVSFPLPYLTNEQTAAQTLYRNGETYQTGTNAISGYYIPWLIFHSTTSSGRPEGIELDPNATQPGTIDPTQPILPQLKQNMPQVFNNPIQETVPQPDGTNKTITYYPVPWPKVTDDTEKPTSGTRNQTDPTVTPDDPTDETSPLVDVITNPNPQPTTPTPGEPATPPDTGSGSSPTVVTPTGNASSLWAVYNPTQAQLDAFGAWLWSSDFVEQIKKLFNDPMQAIVGVHKVFATPPTGGQVNIKCGYIDSGCPAAQVTGQYVTINCGTVNVREYYGNVFDYSPYTEISLYLPFIGIVKLDVADVMRGKVTVIYHVDVITGACLADVKISRDGENSVMYQYSGSAIVTYPISSGSYASMVTGVLSLAAGVAGTIMTGGAAAPALIGGAVGLSHLHTDVQKSGGFSGSPGAMGCKKPYLIISRAQDANPADFEKYEGKPASKTVRLGDCSGFVKVKIINIDNVPATYGELDQIVALLKTGVIL